MTIFSECSSQYPPQLPDAVEEDLVEHYRVVDEVVELGYLAVLSHAYAEELVQRDAVHPILLTENVRWTYE